ncbi:MAG: cytochrome c maturation protein CcmE [Candidatus Marinimicrobia bacterium]|nr:cytochrome c maturation protein CcmE [Candidatus Neomarinimicrobiota bacterium]MCF7828993.1 cytochrome c maturation protein CcmE [Candidatus Neomarinimicrobiota bacterium]MCF7879953.1 cytochrome c maturation protein CcmE [Candidatus Neomarinimicrobiota bacterium]
MTGKQKKFLISGLVIAAALVLIIATGFQGNQVFYVTVDELYAKAPDLYGERIRMAGNVKEGSIDKSENQLFTRFKMVQEGKDLTIEYEGITPDMFKDGAEVIVEGTYSKEGVFHADNLMAKCASRYEADVTDMEGMKEYKEKNQGY